ncbi:MAG: sensor histidine kinase, partial [Pseudobdellovibrio sp.]|nr:sensor histidine kinase [Pseudobdellovibrio sp.]
METRFDPLLVAISFLVAIFASYVALNLASSLSQTRGRLHQSLWLVTGSVAMGFGIWSMHFIGMLAFEMPGMTMAYDLPLMALSIVVAIAASGMAFFIVSREHVPIGSITAGGVSMAAAIAGMHYIGMFSMRVNATIRWNLFLVTLSIAIALIASFSALFIFTRLKRHAERQMEIFFAAIAMGLAIAGMHYTGMYAATFIHTGFEDVSTTDLTVSTGLIIGVVTTTMLVLGLALISSMAQKMMNQRIVTANQTLVSSEEKFRLLVDAVKDYAIFMLNTKGEVTTWNAGAQRISGYSQDEVIGRHMSMFYTQTDIDANTADWELNLAKETGHFEGEGKRLRKDGTWYWASIVIAPLFDENRNLTGFSKVTRDITQFVETEKRMRQLNEELENRVKIRTEALKEREAQLRAITNALPVFIAQVDRSQRILFSNNGFNQWFHQDGLDVIGKTMKEVLGEPRYSQNVP